MGTLCRLEAVESRASCYHAAMRSTIGELGALEVQTPTGLPVRLGTLWADRPTIAVWLRHFGCQYCLEQVAVLSDAHPSFEAAGAQLLLIGNGSPEQAHRFQQLKAPTAIVVTDPERASYRALGARRSPLSMFGRGMVQGWLAARRRGIKAEGLQGDVLQLGGTLVVDPPSTVLLAHLNSSPADHPSVEALLAALSRARPVRDGVAVA